MPKTECYTVEYHCHECGQVHRVMDELLLPGGPGEGGSLDELYPGGDLPSELVQALAARAWCDEAADWVELEDPAGVVLVPHGGAGSDVAGGQAPL